MSASALSPQISRRYQALSMVVRDELCEGVRMGGLYTVIGVPMYKLAEGTQQSFISTVVEVHIRQTNICDNFELSNIKPILYR